MAIKETITIIGTLPQSFDMLLERLAGKGYTLVLVNHEESPLESTGKELMKNHPDADIEIIDCAKEGCWEGDIIMVSPRKMLTPELVSRLENVCNSKVLVYFTQEEKGCYQEIRRLLPHSRIVGVLYQGEDLRLRGNAAAIEKIQAIFKDAGYSVLMTDLVN